MRSLIYYRWKQLAFFLLTDAFLALSLASDNAEFVSCLRDKVPVVSTEIFCLPYNYRKDVPPPTLSPINVYINLPLNEISAIDDQHSQISIRLYYKLLWPEPRMVLNRSADWSSEKKPVGPGLVKFFWTPDLIIHDLVRFYKPEMVEEAASLQIRRENSVQYKLRADLTVVCKGMEFALYPFDRHVCYLKMTSFGHNMDAMILNGGFTYSRETQRELSFNVKVAEVQGSSDVYVGSSNNYSMYALEIHLNRFVTPFLLNVYLPTGMFVVMSWVSFIIPVDIIAARITLLVTLCLVLINSFNNATEKIPVAQVETALEYWISGCGALVFGALAEYAFILFKMINLRRSLGLGILLSYNKGQDSPVKPMWRDSLHASSEGKNVQKLFKEKITDLQMSYDELALIAYPAAFFLFNVFYWVYYYLI